MTSPLPSELTAQHLEALALFEKLLKQESRKQNLVSAGDLPFLRTRHSEDALQMLKLPLKALPEQWLDMGSGAGFPLIPLAIVLPGTRFFGVEPRGNRARFLTRVVRELGLEVQIMASPIEALQDWPNLKGHMDVVSCRALGSTEEDAARALPFLRPGGLFATLKTTVSSTSIDGYDTLSSLPYRLAGDAAGRHLVFAQTPIHGQ
jgi:16S rRNA (guanine527-N7)-methyltransferase